MGVDLSKYDGIEGSCFSRVQLLLISLNLKLLNKDNVSSPSALINIEGCVFVIGLSTNAWWSYQNCSSAILFLWKSEN